MYGVIMVAGVMRVDCDQRDLGKVFARTVERLDRLGFVQDILWKLDRNVVAMNGEERGGARVIYPAKDFGHDTEGGAVRFAGLWHRGDEVAVFGALGIIGVDEEVALVPPARRYDASTARRLFEPAGELRLLIAFFKEFQELGVIFAIGFIDAGKTFVADTGRGALRLSAEAGKPDRRAKGTVAADAAAHQFAVIIDRFKDDNAGGRRRICLGPGAFAGAFKGAVVFKILQHLAERLTLTALYIEPTGDVLLRGGSWILGDKFENCLSVGKIHDPYIVDSSRFSCTHSVWASKSGDKGEDQSHRNDSGDGGNYEHVAHAFSGLALTCFFFLQLRFSHGSRPIMRAPASYRAKISVSSPHLVHHTRL